jgi:hypothetical protein
MNYGRRIKDPKQEEFNQLFGFGTEMVAKIFGGVLTRSRL